MRYKFPERKKRVLFFESGKVLTDELILAFKAECASRNKPMTNVVAFLIRQWLKEMR